MTSAAIAASLRAAAQRAVAQAPTRQHLRLQLFSSAAVEAPLARRRLRELPPPLKLVRDHIIFSVLSMQCM
jgi:hypothetical protein